MRRKKSYFKTEEGDPSPIIYSFSRRSLFGEVDVMAVVWHGHYARLFEEASTELRRKCGLTYEAFFEAGVRAPIVQLHVDYHQPLLLDEQFTVEARMIWSEAARLNIEYMITKENGVVAATGYTVQLFSLAADNLPCFTLPPLLERAQHNWKAGMFNEV